MVMHAVRLFSFLHIGIVFSRRIYVSGERSQQTSRDGGLVFLKPWLLAFNHPAVAWRSGTQPSTLAMNEGISQFTRPVALVTGATKGIGLGIARGLGEKGYRVHITGRTVKGEGSLETAAAAVMEAGGECVTHIVNHADPAAIETLFKDVFSAEPAGVDLLVNNAFPSVDSIGETSRNGMSKFWQLPSSAFAEINDVGLTAHYTASALYAKQMVPRGRGLIVMVSSPGGLFYFFTAAYSTGKAALDRLTTDLAHELKGTGVGCIGLYPGLVQTEKFVAFAAEGLLGMTPEYLTKEGETPLYSGRAVASLAGDIRQNVAHLDALSGTIQWTAEVAVDYGFTDEHGRQPLSARTLRKLTSLPFLPPSLVVPRWLLRLLSPRYQDPSRETQLGPSSKP